MEATEEKTDYARVLELARLVGRLQADIVYIQLLARDIVRDPDNDEEYLKAVNATAADAMKKINDTFNQ